MEESEGIKPILVRRPTLTTDEPVTGKRITFMISSHGLELLDYGLDKRHVNVRVFSLAGELGVCVVRSSKSFNIAAYFDYVKDAMSQSSPGDSTYQMIKILQNEKRDEYRSDVAKNREIIEKQYRDAQEELADLESSLEKEGKRLVKDEYGKWKENHEIFEQKKFIRDIEKILGPIYRAVESTVENHHIRTYEPMTNKMYNFEDEVDYDEDNPEGIPVSRFVKVVHYDGQSEDDQYESLDFKDRDRIESLFSDGEDQDLLEHYLHEHSKKFVTLSTIIAISKKLGFTIINIIDLSCRMAVGDQSAIPEIKEEEARTAVASLVGGRIKRFTKCSGRSRSRVHKCSKKCKQKAQKIHRRRTYKRK
jgi:hypothetical protein